MKQKTQIRLILNLMFAHDISNISEELNKVQFTVDLFHANQSKIFYRLLKGVEASSQFGLFIIAKIEICL